MSFLSLKVGRFLALLFFCLFTTGQAVYAFPTWMGVYGSFVRHTDEANPGTYTILLNQDYFGLNASVGIQVDGGAWTEYGMTWVAKTNNDSLWQFTPTNAYPLGSTIHFYFHGWDQGGIDNIYDSNGGANYSFTVPSLFSPLVRGVAQVVASGSPGPLYAMSDAWMPIVGGDDDSSFPSTYAMARTNGQGRVVALGSDGIISVINDVDNGTFLTNVVTWLDVTQQKKVLYTTGHGEWIQNFTALAQRMSGSGVTFSALPGQISVSALTNGSVLVVGNAWQNFTSNEVEAVRQFVDAGGGLLLMGLGWSWEPYHPGVSIEQYPMIVLARPFDIRWLRSTISDPTDQSNGSPLFHTFYPALSSWSYADATGVIWAAHGAHPTDLAAVLETNANLRTSFSRAHQTLMLPTVELASDHPERQYVGDFSAALVTAFPDFYAKDAPVNSVSFPVAAWSRERFWRTWRDCLPLTDERKAQMINAGHLSGRHADILNGWGIVLLDNRLLAQDQLDFLYAYLSVVPAGLHNLRSISVTDNLGVRPSSMTLDGLPGAVNIFGFSIACCSENSFPADVPAGQVSIFCAAAAHEVNHVVDAYTINNTGSLSARKAQLLQAASTNHMQYLRSMLADGFFAGAPQEFFASIANEWFTDSAKTVQLGLTRFDNGWKNPINQALFFAEVYAQGGDHTRFYAMGTNGVITQSLVRLERDVQGRINALHFAGNIYAFTLDSSSNVSAYVVSADPDSNDNGVPDVWELDQFGSLSVVTTNSDWDHDTVLDRDEYIAGTSPKDAQSFLGVRSPEISGSGFVLRWPGVTGRVYTVSRSTGLVTSVFAPIQSDLPAVTPINSFTDQSAHAESYYKVSVQLAP